MTCAIFSWNEPMYGNGNSFFQTCVNVCKCSSQSDAVWCVKACWSNTISTLEGRYRLGNRSVSRQPRLPDAHQNITKIPVTFVKLCFRM
eukprot:3688040-Amphidinium_carterae.1